MRKGLIIALGVAVLGSLPTPAPSQMRTLNVDAGKVIGVIRNLQGVDLGPLTPPDDGSRDLTKQYKDIGVSLIRTHDNDGPTHRYRISEKENLDSVGETSSRGGTLVLSNPLPPPAVELIVLQRR